MKTVEFLRKSSQISNRKSHNSFKIWQILSKKKSIASKTSHILNQNCRITIKNCQITIIKSPILSKFQAKLPNQIFGNNSQISSNNCRISIKHYQTLSNNLNHFGYKWPNLVTLPVIYTLLRACTWTISDSLNIGSTSRAQKLATSVSPSRKLMYKSASFLICIDVNSLIKATK